MLINTLFILLLFAFFFLSGHFLLKNRENDFTRLLFVLIVITHATFFIYNWDTLANKETDYKKFFDLASSSNSWVSMFGMGNKSIAFLIYPLTKIGLSFFSLSLLFTVISFYGYLIYLKLLTKDLKHKKHIEKALIVLFFIMPSLHFWTVCLGKEAIIFTLMAIILDKVDAKKVNSISLIISALIILLIRPYLFLLLMAPIVALNFKRFNRLFKVLVVFFIPIGTMVVAMFLKIKNLESFYSNYYKIAIYARNNGSSSIDLLESNYFERVFLVLFRPLFYDAKVNLHYYVSLENTVYIIIFLGIVFLCKYFRLGVLSMKFNFLLIYIISIIGFYGIYMYNLGLASRMRVLFIPYTIVLLLMLLSFKNRTYVE